MNSGACLRTPSWILSIRPHRALQALVLAAFLAAPPLAALDPGRALTQYIQTVWRQNDGLPQNTVNTITQTRDGYLWVGTEEGLVRFDGVEFTVFDRKNTPAIKNNFIMTLLEDREGSLWIGTYGGGLVRFRDGVFTSFDKSHGLTSERIRALFEDQSGKLWIATAGGGLNSYAKQSFSALRGPEGIPNDRVWSVAEGKNGDLYIGTYGGGLSVMRGGKISPIDLGTNSKARFIRPMRVDAAGNLWIGTDGAGLYRIQNGEVSVFDTANGFPSLFVRTLLADRDGNLWIGTDDAGLVRYRDGRFSSLNAENGLSNDSVLALFEDREGSLFIGTSGGGLNRLRNGKFVNLTPKEGLSHEVTRSVLEDREGGIWIATTGGGVTRLLNGRASILRQENGLLSGLAFALHEDRAGKIWIGTDGGGVSVLENGKLSSITVREGLLSDRVRSICGDQDGSIWVGTVNGLTRIKDGRFESYTPRDGLAGNSVRILLEARGGGIWIGTDGGGLTRFQNGRFTSWTVKDGLSSARVFSLYEDQEGVLWIGTSGGGLNRLAFGTLRSITTQQGLFDDVIFQIVEDDSGNFWMSCNKGVFRTSREGLNKLASGKIKSISCDSFGTADGMRSAECNGGSPAGWRLRDGRILFPTVRGVTVIDPRRIPVNELPPPVHIQRFLADQEEIRHGGRIRPGAEQFEIHFTALSLLVPEKVRFRYRLKGFDRNWIDAGTRRTAYYTNLRHGEYTFQVKACNNDGVWNETGASFRFTLEPFFYQTYWFFLLCFGVAVAGSFGLHRVRIQTLERRERELERVVAERTSQLQERTLELQRAHEQIEKLSTTSAGVLEDPVQWARSVARETARSIGAREIGIWIVRDGALVPLASGTLRIPEWNQMEEAIRQGGFLARGDRSLVPVLGMTGEPHGVLVVDGPGIVWGDVQKSVVGSLARHLGTALDLRTLRDRLTTSESARLTNREEMHKKGIRLAAICPACGDVFEDAVLECPRDRLALDWSRLYPLKLGNRYLLLRWLGEGGMGAVFRARDERLGREVAVKVILPGRLREAGTKLRFEREARIVAQIQHPAVVSIFDTGGLEDGSEYLVMEYLRGVNLANAVSRYGPGTPAQVARLIRQVGGGLSAAHGVGVIHRDIKPENIFLVPSPGGFQARLLDFGIAKSLHMDSQITRTGMIVGTPAYMAPEQVKGETVEKRSDLYSFAAAAYEALSARPVVAAGEISRVFMDVLQNMPDPLSVLVPGLSIDVDLVFARALAKKVEDRPATVSEWVDAVSSLLDAASAPGTKGWPGVISDGHDEASAD